MVYFCKLQIIIFSIFVLFFINSESIGPQKLYSNKELLAIDEFRPMVTKFLTMDFHKTDAYLLRWIRFGNFDLSVAAKDLEKFHKYRAANDIDSILDSDETQPALTPNPYKHLPYIIKGHDKGGHPLVFVKYGRWNLRKYVIAGKPKIPQRHFEEMFERMLRKAFREGAASGKDIDQFTVVADLNGFSLRETYCIACVPIYTSNVRTSVNYGAFFKNCTTVNTPRIFGPALSIIKAFPGVKRVPLHFYDFDKATWQKNLLEEISRDQLLPEYQ